MDKYTVLLYSRAERDLDEIYAYIAQNLSEPQIASDIIDVLENAVLSLETLPERGSLRKTGVYAYKGYRQLFVKNYIIIYRVIPEKKEVHIITVRYARSQF